MIRRVARPSTMQTGARVYAKGPIRYHGGVDVIHKGGKGTVVHALGSTLYVRWDWTGDTYPTDAHHLGSLERKTGC